MYGPFTFCSPVPSSIFWPGNSSHTYVHSPFHYSIHPYLYLLAIGRSIDDETLKKVDLNRPYSEITATMQNYCRSTYTRCWCSVRDSVDIMSQHHHTSIHLFVWSRSQKPLHFMQYYHWLLVTYICVHRFLENWDRCSQGKKLERLSYTVSSISNHLGTFSLLFIVKKNQKGCSRGIHRFCGCRGTWVPPTPTLDPPLDAVKDDRCT